MRARGFTLIELLVVLAIVAVVSALGMAGYRNARIKGNETAAIASLSAINEAQAAFAMTCGNGHYAPNLVALGTPMPATGQAFLSSDLTGADPLSKSGYRFVLLGTDAGDGRLSCTGVTPVATYQVTADPLMVGFTGVRSFGSNTDRIIYQDVASFAGNMPETGAPGHGAEIR